MKVETRITYAGATASTGAGLVGAGVGGEEMLTEINFAADCGFKATRARRR